MPGRIYTPERLAWLAQAYRVSRLPELTRRFNRRFGLQVSEHGLKTALVKHRVRAGRPPGFRPGEAPRTWTPDMVQWLAGHRCGVHVADLTRRLNARFGTALSESAVRQTLTRYRIPAASDGRFRPGDRPWNIGRTGYAPIGRARETTFQPGQRPHTWLPIWSYRKDSEGYWWLKVSETVQAGESRRDWRPVARLTWEGAHGPVPPGHCVVFVDGDPDHCTDPDNLACISRATLARLNQLDWMRLVGDPAARRAAIAAAELITATHKAADRAGLTLHQRRQVIPTIGPFAAREDTP